MGYDANNDYHQGVGYFAYDEAKVVNIVLKFKLRLLESQVLSKMTLGFDYPFLPRLNRWAAEDIKQKLIF